MKAQLKNRIIFVVYNTIKYVLHRFLFFFAEYTCIWAACISKWKIIVYLTRELTPTDRYKAAKKGDRHFPKLAASDVGVIESYLNRNIPLKSAFQHLTFPSPVYLIDNNVPLKTFPFVNKIFWLKEQFQLLVIMFYNWRSLKCPELSPVPERASIKSVDVV